MVGPGIARCPARCDRWHALRWKDFGKRCCRHHRGPRWVATVAHPGYCVKKQSLKGQTGWFRWVSFHLFWADGGSGSRPPALIRTARCPFANPANECDVAVVRPDKRIGPRRSGSSESSESKPSSGKIVPGMGRASHQGLQSMSGRGWEGPAGLTESLAPASPLAAGDWGERKKFGEDGGETTRSHEDRFLRTQPSRKPPRSSS